MPNPGDATACFLPKEYSPESCVTFHLEERLQNTRSVCLVQREFHSTEGADILYTLINKSVLHDVFSTLDRYAITTYSLFQFSTVRPGVTPAEKTY